VDDKYFIEIFENTPAHYKKGDEYKLLSRGRLADQIIKEHTGDQQCRYVPISLVEMEYAQDEAEYLERILADL